MKSELFSNKIPMWNESFRHCLASLGNTKEKCSLQLSGGGEIFLEKGKDIFL